MNTLEYVRNLGKITIYGSYQSWSWAGSIHGLGWVGLDWVGLGRDFEIIDGLGWVGSKTVGRLTQSVCIDDVYKLNI